MSQQAGPADHVFHELTRSICPVCRRVIDAQVLLRGGKVYMRKRCPEHGPFEALIYADAEAYTSLAKYNRPGARPLARATAVDRGCPHDCGLCPDHEQHTCVGIIEVNTACNMHCPLCFADAGAGFQLSLPDVEGILDRFVAAEGSPEVVQFSGGEPSIHPEIVPMLRAARDHGIRHVMLNTNGKRIATDDAFVAALSELRVSVYFQFDGFEPETYRILRGEPDILTTKLRALDRLAEARCSVILVPAIERGVNESEIGRIVDFALAHPAVRGINFQAAFHAGRHPDHDPLHRMTIPEMVGKIQEQTAGRFRRSDFVPVPCCFPICNSVTYAYVEGEEVLPIPRLIRMDDYLDYIANRVVPDVGPGWDLKDALERLWSSAAVPGTPEAVRDFALSCAACGIDVDLAGLRGLADRMFMIMLQDFMDPWTFSQKNVMKCCKAVLLPDGRQIPFCAYNNLGYREQVRSWLANRRSGPAEREPLTFVFPA